MRFYALALVAILTTSFAAPAKADLIDDLAGTYVVHKTCRMLPEAPDEKYACRDQLKIARIAHDTAYIFIQLDQDGGGCSMRGYFKQQGDQLVGGRKAHDILGGCRLNIIQDKGQLRLTENTADPTYENCADYCGPLAKFDAARFPISVREAVKINQIDQLEMAELNNQGN